MIDAFAIGVRIAMSSNGPEVLGVMLSKILGLHVATDNLTGALNRVKIAAVGAVGVFAGDEALRGIAGLIGAARDLNAELNRTAQLGGRFAATLPQARAAAFAASAGTPVFSADQMVKFQRELGTQLSSPEAGIAITPFASRAAYVAGNYTEENPEDIIKNLVKVADLRGKIFSKDANGKEVIDPAKAADEMQYAVKALQIAGGYLKSNDLVKLARQAGVPIRGMTPQAFYAEMVEAAVAQGASRAGTSVTALYSQLVGGRMSAQTAAEMQRFGLLDAGDYRSDHGHIVTSPAASARFAGVMADPVKYIEGPLAAAFDKAGLNPQDRLAEIFRLFGRQTTQRFVGEAMLNGPQFERALGLQATTPGVDAQFKGLDEHDLNTSIVELQKTWKDFTESLGSAGIPLAITVLHDLTGVLNQLTKWSEKHPTIAKDLLGLAAALSVLAIASGGMAVTIVTLRTIASVFTVFSGGAAGVAVAGERLTSLASGVTALGIAGRALGALGWIGLLVTLFTALPPLLHRIAVAINGGEGDPDKIQLRGSSHANQTLRLAPYTPNLAGKSMPAGSAQDPMHVHVTNPGAIGSAVGGGLTGGLSAAPTGPSGSTSQYRPRSPGQ